MAKTFEPLYSQILVLEIDAEQTIDGVTLPETTKEDMKFGKVVTVGEGHIQPDGTIRPLRVQVGDLVVYGMYAGIPVRLEGVEFRCMLEGEVIGRIKDA